MTGRDRAAALFWRLLTVAATSPTRSTFLLLLPVLGVLMVLTGTPLW